MSGSAVGHHLPSEEFTPQAMRALADVKPDVWSDLRMDFEGWLARVIRAGGLEAAREALKSLDERGFRFVEVRATPTTLALASPLPPDGMIMEVESTYTDYWIAAQLTFSEPEPEPETPDEDPDEDPDDDNDVEGEKQAVPGPDPRHERFYALWQEMTGLPERKVAGLDATRKAVYLVALLEAELNNGGFGQYLDNTDAQFLDATLEVLERIDAPDTTRLLGEAALLLEESGVDPADAWNVIGDELEELDEAFQRAAEDLAGAVMDVFGDAAG